MTLPDDIVLARAINWELGLAEKALGLPEVAYDYRTRQCAMGLTERLDRVLAAASRRPGVISAQVYGLLYMTREARPQPAAIAAPSDPASAPSPQDEAPPPEERQHAEERQLSLDIAPPPKPADEAPRIRFAPLPGGPL
jgi:hypothetical protein